MGDGCHTRYEGAEPYVQPIDARYGGPAFPLGTDPGAACSAFEQWCADHLSGNYYVTAAASCGLVHCRSRADAELVQAAFGEPSSFFGRTD